jgi:hypothetical protein
MKDKDTTCTFTTVVLADMTGDYERLSKSIFHSSGAFQGLFDVMKREFNSITIVTIAVSFLTIIQCFFLNSP